MTHCPLLDLLDDPCFLFDETRVFLDWNWALLAATGYSEAQLTTATPQDVLEGVDLDRLVGSVAGSGADGRTVEAELVTVDGERIPHEVEVRRVPDGDGGAVRFAGICRGLDEGDHRRERVGTREQVLRKMYEITADRGRPFTEQVEALLGLGRAELDTAYGTLSKIDSED